MLAVVRRMALAVALLAFAAPAIAQQPAPTIESFYKGREVKIITPLETVVGIAETIEPDGALRVQTTQGPRVFTSAEVSLRF